MRIAKDACAQNVQDYINMVLRLLQKNNYGILGVLILNSIFEIISLYYSMLFLD